VLTLFILSFLLIFAGMLLIFLSTLRKGLKEYKEDEDRIRGGAILVIGPLPIVIGTDRKIAKTLIVLAIALTVTSVLLFLILNWSIMQSIASKLPTLYIMRMQTLAIISR